MSYSSVYDFKVLQSSQKADMCFRDYKFTMHECRSVQFDVFIIIAANVSAANALLAGTNGSNVRTTAIHW